MGDEWSACDEVGRLDRTGNLWFSMHIINRRSHRLQGGQLYMAWLVWYRVKRYSSSVGYSTVAYNSVTFDKVPEQHGHDYLVTLYIMLSKTKPYRVYI